MADLIPERTARTIAFATSLGEAVTGGLIYDRTMASALAEADDLGPVQLVDPRALLIARQRTLSSVFGRWAYARRLARPIAWTLPELAGMRRCGLLVFDQYHGDVLLPVQRERASAGRPSIAIVHHVDDVETDALEVDRRHVHDSMDAVRLADATVVPSAYTKAVIVRYGVDPQRVRVISPGVPDERWSTTVEPRPFSHRLVTVGGIVPRKGLDLLPEVLAGLGPPWTMDVLGGNPDSPYGRQLQESALRLGVGDRLRFLGRVSSDRMLDALVSADIYLTTSRNEGFGMAIAEAMQLGLPVVASDAGAIPELVQHGVTGLLCDRDRPKAFVAALQQLAASAPLREQLREAARQRIAVHCSWDASRRLFVALVRQFGDA